MKLPAKKLPSVFISLSLIAAGFIPASAQTRMQMDVPAVAPVIGAVQAPAAAASLDAADFNLPAQPPDLAQTGAEREYMRDDNRAVPAGKENDVAAWHALGNVDLNDRAALSDPLAAVKRKVKGVLRVRTAVSAGAQLESLNAAGAPAQNIARHFDGAGFQPGPKRTDLEFDSVEVPEASKVGALSWSLLRSPRPALQPTVLPGNPQDADGVEKALRQYITQDPASFGNLKPENFVTVVKHKVEGAAGLATTVYVAFQQQINGVPVEGTFFDFTVKIFDGKAVAVGSRAYVVPRLAVNTAGTARDLDLRAKAAARIKSENGANLRDLGLRVMHLDGAWRAVRVYSSLEKRAYVAVDINDDHKAFAWDPTASLDGGDDKNSRDRAVGRGVEFDPVTTGKNLVELPLQHLTIKLNGKDYETDSNGYIDLKATAETKIKVKLAGRYAWVEDQDGKNIEVEATVKPGRRAQIVFNEEGYDEGRIAQVNIYHHYNREIDFVKANKWDIPGIDTPIPLRPNTDDECNAYYTPQSPSVNTFKSSPNCINTGYDTVVMHEAGHHMHNLALGATGVERTANGTFRHVVNSVIGVNGGLSESWGDIFAMLITRQPVTGEHFLKNRNPSWVREGNNTTKYNSHDEVHKQGEVGMGFVWKLFKGVEKQEQEALAQSNPAASAAQIAQEAADKAWNLVGQLVIPTIFTSRDIPDMIGKVLERDIQGNGNIPHWDAIQAAAAAHGIKLKKPFEGDSEPQTIVSRIGVKMSLWDSIALLARRAARSV